MPLEPERSSRPPDWVNGQGCGELAPATAGSASWVPRHATTATLFYFGNFMKKEGRNGTAGRGIAGGLALPIRGGEDVGDAAKSRLDAVEREVECGDR